MCSAQGHELGVRGSVVMVKSVRVLTEIEAQVCVCVCDVAAAEQTGSCRTAVRPPMPRK